MDFWTRFKKNKLALGGSFIVVIFFVVSIFAPPLRAHSISRGGGDSSRGVATLIAKPKRCAA